MELILVGVVFIAFCIYFIINLLFPKKKTSFSLPSDDSPVKTPAFLPSSKSYYRRFTNNDDDHEFRSSQSAIIGDRGENQVVEDLRSKLDGNYAIFHNVVLPTNQGDTTQIDIVVLSVYGVFVLEVKNYSGWIFGKEKDSHWTQSAHGKKSRFQNPLRQNYKHTQAISFISSLPKEKIYSVVVFPSPDVEIKTEMPLNVVRSPVPYIHQFKQRVITEEQIKKLFELIFRLQKIK